MIRQLIEGLLILSTYTKKGIEEWIGGAEHDIIYGPIVSEVNEADAARLELLGWGQNEDGEGWYFFT